MTHAVYTSDIAWMKARAKLFPNGRSQAVRLPKAFRFTGTEVNIERRGDEVVLTPVEGKWARFVREMPHISQRTADIMMRVVEENRRERTPPRDYFK